MESFHSRVRDELLNLELFSCLPEARVLVEDWREDYNQRRPHSSLGRKAPRRLRRRLDAGHLTGPGAPRADVETPCVNGMIGPR